MEYDLTVGVDLDGNTYAGDLVRALTDRQTFSPPLTDKARPILDTQRGVYVPRWGSGKDDTIFICHERVNVDTLRKVLYKSDFGYTFSEKNPQPWTTVDGDRWLPEWLKRESNELERHESKDSDGHVKRDAVHSLLPSFCATIGGRERLDRSVVILPVYELAHLNLHSDKRVITLKKVGKTHGKTIYALVDKGQDAKDFGYVITFQKGERPPALHVVRDTKAKIFCLMIGDHATKRFDTLTKENVHKTFSHYEGRISKHQFAAK